MDSSERMLKLKIGKSKEVLRDAFKRFKNVGIAWSTGKDSTITLFLTRELKPNILVLFCDTTKHFKETYDFRNKLVEEWNLKLINILPKVSFEKVKGDRSTCCHALKTESLLKKAEELDLDAVITGNRWNEVPSSTEDYISQRKEENVYKHSKINPLLHWTEKDVWTFIKMNKIPYNPLYDKKFLSIECKACPTPIRKAESKKVERERDIDRKKIVQRLRALGYW